MPRQAARTNMPYGGCVPLSWAAWIIGIYYRISPGRGVGKVENERKGGKGQAR